MLSGNAKLTLIVDGTLSVYGGAAGKGGDAATSTPGPGGQGGNAGIAVPYGTVLTIAGSGTLNAHGGDAGRGGDCINGISGGNIGAGGGGGAGAGIGGAGGSGGAGGAKIIDGGNGGNGSAIGTVNILGAIIVNAYGGGGGSGSMNQTSGTGGAGGYPAAGVGGGGAGGGGGDWDDPGGGFTGGRPQGNSNGYYLTINGEGGGNGSWGLSGSYFRADYTSNYADEYEILQGLGGIGSTYLNYNPANQKTKAGDGGTGGAGGTVNVSETATLHAYNGSHITTIPQNYGNDPTPIYAQSGYDLALLRTAGVTKVDARTKSALESELGAKGKSSSITPTGLAGVGSGAGCTESSNGTRPGENIRDMDRMEINREFFKFLLCYSSYL